MVATRRDLRMPAIVGISPRASADGEGRDVPASNPAVEGSAFRHAFRQLASTVAVMTLTGRDGRPHGMTVTSMCGLSLDPPTLLVCIDRSTRTYGDLVASETFGIDVLAEGQHAVAAHCARPGSDKILPRGWLLDAGASDLPHLAGSVVRLECRIETIHPASTHDIVIGLVEAIDVDPEPLAPLLYHDGAFVRLDPGRIPLSLADRAARLDEG